MRLEHLTEKDEDFWRGVLDVGRACLLFALQLLFFLAGSTLALRLTIGNY